MGTTGSRLAGCDNFSVFLCVVSGFVRWVTNPAQHGRFRLAKVGGSEVFMSDRYLNISQMARLFDLSRDTIRSRLRSAGVTAAKVESKVPFYDVAKAAPVIFAKRCDVCGR